ncbi:hypothetical protein WJX73_008479 [Symbiochloris irregularis]|uniref:BZIP domain-containing protein n=1 Tax=Symbiochloris irregularis TaxID=706552 RepID=A0AAW1NW52_9CHLO
MADSQAQVSALEGADWLRMLAEAPRLMRAAYAETQDSLGPHEPRQEACSPGDTSATLEKDQQQLVLDSAVNHNLVKADDDTCVDPASDLHPFTAGAPVALQMEHARALASTRSDQSVHSELSGPGASEDMDMYNIRRARRRMSNRDSARRTRQRKLDEVKELQDQVAALTADKTRLLLHQQELRFRYQDLAAHLPQMQSRYEAALDDNRRLQGENADLRSLLEVDMPSDFHTVPQMDIRALAIFSEACMQA